MTPMTTMTADELIEGFKSLPPEERGRVKLEIVAFDGGVEDVFVPTLEQKADVDRALKAIEEGDVCGVEEMRAMLYR